MPEAEEPTDLEVVIHGMSDDEPQPFHVPVGDSDETPATEDDETREVELELPDELGSAGPMIFGVDDEPEVDPTHPPAGSQGDRGDRGDANDAFGNEVSDDFDLDSLEAAVAELGLDGVDTGGHRPPPPPSQLTPPPAPPGDLRQPEPPRPPADAPPPPHAGPEAHAAPPPPAPPPPPTAGKDPFAEPDDAGEPHGADEPGPPEAVDVANFTAHGRSRKRGLFGR